MKAYRFIEIATGNVVLELTEGKYLNWVNMVGGLDSQAAEHYRIEEFDDVICTDPEILKQANLMDLFGWTD